MNKYLSNFIALFIPWLLMSNKTLQDIGLGIIIAAILSIIIKDYLEFNFGKNIIIQTIKFIGIYIPIFIFELIKANIDVAMRVLSPSLPINPGFVKVPTDLKNNYAKLILANSITLTPGTLSIDADDHNIYIHWISVKGNSSKKYQENVSKSFENILGGIFE